MPENELVVRRGKIFEIGSFPDKNFEFDDADMERAIASFTPVPIDLEHTDTVLQGKMGQVNRIYPSDDGKSLMGEVHLPTWLDSLLTDGERKVSATWDRATKQLKGLALVRSPRVSDAALMAAFTASAEGAAFAKHATPSGQSTIQAAHDALARGGAVCNKPAAMASRPESNTIQAAHDELVKHGAQCENVKPGQSMPAMYANKTTTRSKRMNLKELLLGAARAQDADADETEIEREVNALFSHEPDPKVSELEAALKEANDRAAALETSQKNQDAQFARINDDRRHQDAVAFANKQIAEGRLPAAAATALVPLAESIAKHETTVQFAEGEPTQSSLLDEFMKSLGEAFAIFGKSVVPSTKVEAMFSQETTPGVGEAEAREDVLKRMRAATPAGRQIEHDKQNGNHA